MKIIGLLVLGVIGYVVLHSTVQSFKMSRIAKKSTADLKALFKLRSNFCYYAKATEELRGRGEDISFTFPTFLDLALSGGLRELIGKGCLQSQFGEKLSHIDLTGEKLTPEAKAQLEELKEQVEKLTNA